MANDNEKLKAMLGADAYAELMATLAQFLQGKATVVAVEPEWQKVAWGVVKSKTIWLGVAIAGLPQLLPIISPELQQLMTPAMYRNVMLVAGVAVAIVRFYTVQPIKDKGTT